MAVLWRGFVTSIARGRSLGRREGEREREREREDI